MNTICRHLITVYEGRVKKWKERNILFNDTLNTLTALWCQKRVTRIEIIQIFHVLAHPLIFSTSTEASESV